MRITIFTGKEQAVLGVYRGCLTVSSTDRACYKCCPIPTAHRRDLLRDLAQVQQEGSASTCFTIPPEAYLHLWHLNIINNLALPPSMPHFQVRGIEHPILGLLKEKKNVLKDMRCSDALVSETAPNALCAEGSHRGGLGFSSGLLRDGTDLQSTLWFVTLVWALGCAGCMQGRVCTRR